MGNVIYDIGPDWMIDPFIGAGGGVNHISLTTRGQFSNVTGVITPIGGANPSIQQPGHRRQRHGLRLAGHRRRLAWKATDRLNVDATYRFLDGSSGQFNSTGTAALQPGTFQGKYRDNSITVGLRYSFAAPPPAAAAAPPPAAPASPAASPAAPAPAASSCSGGL